MIEPKLPRLENETLDPGTEAQNHGSLIQGSESNE